ncbi:translation initiation factor IF-2 [Barnesiella sp. An55]|uniref:translation initiation factor IF-2 n=1 Tax=Barnesiella sp. An55 TaxID=1965646 RepID=UPI000B386062|nr:translation initiation factor IF-2 [Barnesiella sp. An55]OUN74284.1 translation initiation factor IF-2 [Barnesiella sp. An55]HIZ27529.1 translation initiation factor IF-2 [Candidatus Barnesiella merdipullorum]
MSIRLNKVARDLNVGIQTAVEFLQKKGFTVEANPNAKITDEQYALLVKEFSKDKNLKLESESISLERHKEKIKAAAEAEEKKEAAAKEESKELKTIIPEPQRPKVVGHLDLDALNRPKSADHGKHQETPVEKKEEPKPVEKPVEEKKEVAPKPVEVKPQAEAPAQPVRPAAPAEPQKPAPAPAAEAQAPAEPAKKQESPAAPAQESHGDEKHDDEVFTLGRPSFTSNINVVGRIDLDALNQQTRPKKKSKEEKRKERENKEKQRQEAHKSTTGNGEDANTQGGERRKRQRINKEKVDISKSISSMGGNQPARGGNGKNNGGNNNKPNKQKQRPIKAEVSEEDVQKQIKETLARLTTKGQKKSAKWRKEKREAYTNRERELAEMEEAESKVLKLTEFVTANDLASMMNVPVNEVIATCMSIGIMVSINQRLDAETINIVAEEFGFKTEYVSAEVVEAIHEEEDKEEDLQSRPPVVTVMGHVDHGKTSLLDYIRNSNVIAGEAGGITQHIGAYNVKLDDGRRITFLDTPGHEAFTAMRARGAQMTDIAIIIVAADDNVMPQTVEAINHASAAGVPIVFAINKIDKPNANPDKIKEELANMNYLVEDWGGKYQSQEISAKKGTGVHELMEKVLLEAELLDLKANPNRKAVGSIIESTLDKGRGYVATVLVQNGTLHKGDVVLAGTNHGKVKAMFNERNVRIDSAGPSAPVQILGLNGAPQAGDTFHVMDTEQEAREIANKREQLQRELGLRTHKLLTLDDIGRRIAVGNFQELNLVVKGDVDGSVEALSDSLIKLSTPEIQINVLHKAVGQISESDVTLAAASNAVIIGFQVRPSVAARRLAEKEGVDIRLYSIIYDAIEEVKSAMEGMLSPEIKEEIQGTAEVLETYHITKVGTVAGCIVKEGKIKRSSKVRLIRDGIVIFSGDLGSLKRFKDDVKEVTTGFECGLNIANYNDVKVGDLVEAYEEVEVKKTL